ncbi:tol-pal system protein YbgF [Aurantimonas sp. A2-1-M11]|uniref:tol-pal system protein YbgF n=1 Tax=Aurantimonas sp. A2-1-M11 TaxID=3113712 RepID=UPI002F926CC7
MMFRQTILAVSALALMGTATGGASAFELPGLFGETATGAARQAPAETRTAPVRMAQAGDMTVRINQLEEEVRRLNGRVEELSFQLLRTQEDMRKQQEDNEFRFQQLEGGSGQPGAAGTSVNEQHGDAGPAMQGQSGAGGSEQAAAGEDDIGRLLGGDMATGALDTANLQTGVPGLAETGQAGDSSTVAAIAPGDQGETYGLAYNYLLAGDYQLAEQAFRQYAQTYPTASDVPDARYWLGESLYQQQKFAEAAEVFLEAQKSFPDNGKAPEMMLKLGMSLAKLDNQETACITYKEVAKRYPQMSSNVRNKLASEEATANC